MSDLFSPLLARIDDRLIHGQVVVGCCEPLGARCIVLVDDEVATDPLQQKLYRAAVPPEVEVRFAQVDTAPAIINEMEEASGLQQVMVVVARARIMERLRTAGARFRRIQLGGAHAREGTTEVLPGVFLDAEDRRALRALSGSGTEVFVQAVAASATRLLTESMLAEGDA